MQGWMSAGVTQAPSTCCLLTELEEDNSFSHPVHSCQPMCVLLLALTRSTNDQHLHALAWAQAFWDRQGDADEGPAARAVRNLEQQVAAAAEEATTGSVEEGPPHQQQQQQQMRDARH